MWGPALSLVLAGDPRCMDEEEEELMSPHSLQCSAHDDESAGALPPKP